MSGAPASTRPRAGQRITDLAALVTRLPRPGPAALTFSLVSAVVGNAYLFWQVRQGDLPLVGIVLLVAVEGVVLRTIAALQRRRVPAAHRMEMADPGGDLPTKLTKWLGFVLGIGGAYLMWATLLGQLEVLRGFLSSITPWIESGLHIALALTIAFALFEGLADRQHYRRHGPPFVSSIALEANARSIVFAYGSVVIALPLLGVLAVATWAMRRRLETLRHPHATLIGGLGGLATFFASFFALAGLADRGPEGWAAVYLLGKLVVEAAFVGLPVLARQAAGHPADEGGDR